MSPGSNSVHTESHVHDSINRSHISLKCSELFLLMPLLGVHATEISDKLDLISALLGLLLLGSLEALLLAGEKGVDRRVELVAAVEEVELHHKEETDEVAAEFADERASCGCGTAWIGIVSWAVEAVSPSRIGMTYQ
jgi:hypothetical protein